MGPRLHVNSRLQACIERFLCSPQIGVGQLVVVLTTNWGDEHAESIDADFQLMRPLQSGHVADDVLKKPDAEVVLGVEWEVVLDENSAARAERQSLNVTFLR